MNFRTTFFMLGLLAAVGALVYFGRKGTGTEDLNKTEKKIFKDGISEKFIRIELKRGEETIVFELDAAKKAWSITSPIKEVASGPEVERIKSKIDELEKEQTFQPGDPKIDMKGWELEPPKAVLTVKGGGVDHTFRLGGLTPSTKQAYLQMDDGKEVLVVSSDLYNAVVEKKLADFRDRALLQYDTFAVDRLTITLSGQDVELAYQDGTWRLVRPVSDRADVQVVNEVLRVAKDLVVKDFVEDGAKEMKKYGLDVPSLKLSVVPRGESTAQVLLIGGPKEGDKTKVYARRENSDNVVTVEANNAEKLKRTLDDLRDKKVFDFDNQEIVKISVQRIAKAPPRLGGPFLDRMYRSMGYVRREPVVTLDKASDSWMMTEPAAYPFDLMSVSPWLEELTKTLVVEFRDSEKPDGPPYHRGSEAELLLVLERRPFGTSVSQRMSFPLIPLDANRTATWRPNGDRVLVIGSNLFERLRRGAALFRRKMLLDIRSEQVSRVSIEARGEGDAVSMVQAEVVEGPPRAWKVLSPTGGALDEVALTDVLRRAGTLVAREFLADEVGEVEKLRPAKPRLTMKITFGSEMAEGEQGPRSEQLATLTVGEKGDNGYTAVFEMEGGVRLPVAFVLDEASFTDLTRKVLK